MSEIKQEAVSTSGEMLAKRVLGGLGRLAHDAMYAGPTPVMGRQSVRLPEGLSYFDAEAPQLPLAEVLDHLDAVSDEQIISSAMSGISVHKTDAQ